jgi:DNA primase
MSTSADFKDTLKQQADIIRIIGDYVKLKKAGAQNYSGLCPFHNEKTPSFSVHATRQFYHCFGCGASGDVFSFVQKIENVTFPEAVRIIAQRAGVPMPAMTFSSPQEAREARHRTELLEIHDRACEFFQEYLRRPEGGHAREYLKGRGLDQETIKRFRIGYAPDSGFILRDRLKGEFSEEVLRESGLFSWKERGRESGQESGVRSQLRAQRARRSGEQNTRSLDSADHSASGVTGSARDDTDSELKPGAESREPKAESRVPEAWSPKPEALYSKFRNRVVFPICNDAGRVIAFTGRTLSADEKAGPKYLNSPETPIYSKSRVLFSLDQAKEAIRKLDYAILVEGQMDCISVYAAGFHNVIASSGTAFTDAQAKLLGRFSKNVVVNFDPDTAGARATERTLGLLVEEEFNIRVVTLEPGFDPDLFIRRRGKEAYADALRNSQRYFDYLIERARTQFPVKTGEGKVKAVNFLLPHIQRVPSRIVRDELAHEIAQKLGIDSAVLRQELRHVAATRSAATVKAPAEGQVTAAERILVRALASAREIQAGEGHVSARDGAEEDFDPARQAQFALENERLHEGLATESLIETLLQAGPDTRDVMELPLADDDRRRLASILMRGGEELSPELLEETVRALRQIKLDRVLASIQAEIVEAEKKRRAATSDEERIRQDMALAELGMRQHKLQQELGAVEVADRSAS